MTNLTSKRKKNDADGQAKRVNDDKKKWTCVNLNEKSVLNGPEVALCLLNQCRQRVPLCNMTHLFTLLSSWQRDQTFSIVLVMLYPLQLLSGVVSRTADDRSSQCGWSSDANCSANEFKPELRFSLKKIYRAILLLPRVIGWDAAS